MKKTFILQLFWFMLPVVIFTILVEFYYRTQTGIIQKKQYIENNSKNIELLFLGSSHIAQGINPEFLTKNTINLANSAQVLAIDYFLLEKYIDKLPNVKTVILEIAPLSLYSDFVEGYEMNYLFSNLWGIKYKVDSKSYKNYSILFSAFKLYSVEFLKYLNPLNHETASINKYGFTQLALTGSKFYELNYDSIKIDKTFIMPHNFTRNEHFKNSQIIIEKISKKCKEKKIKLIFITTPYYKTYYNHIPLKTKIKIKTLVNKFVKNYNVSYFDFSDASKIKNITVNDFEDDHHLNYKGAKKFTILVDSTLNFN